MKDIWLLQCKITWRTTSEIPLLVKLSEIKIDLTLKKANFLFLECFKIKFIQFIQVC